uniref:Uncharacterized protein n=1 Tax=Plectus sambesii TaxID=2011161 RepID=A0A914WG88_9BILA
MLPSPCHFHFQFSLIVSLTQEEATMSSQKSIIVLALLVAIAAAAPKGGLIPDSPDAITGGNHGNSTGRDAVDCVALPTNGQCLLCRCTWENNQCVGNTSIC